jgi:hypothetical protein
MADFQRRIARISGSSARLRRFAISMNCIANPSGLTAARARVFQGIMDRVLTVSGDGTVSASQPASASKDPVAAIDHQYMDKTVAYLVQNQVSHLESYLPVLPRRGTLPLHRIAGDGVGYHRLVS